MLHRIKVAQELAVIADQLFTDANTNFKEAQQIWQNICLDVTFIHHIKLLQPHAQWPVPTWQGQLNQTQSLTGSCTPYQIVSVDGSQIYPDKHNPLPCFLINIGSVILRYGIDAPSVHFDSKPFVYRVDDPSYELPISVEVVNCMRHEQEFLGGLAVVQQVKEEFGELPLFLVFDGSLVFWHLEAKDIRLKDIFLSKYISVLHQLYQRAIPTASYMSMPKSRELVNLIRIGWAEGNLVKAEQCTITDRLVDATVVEWFLQPCQRTIVFKNHAGISKEYPDHVHPHFFYIHVADEVGRVEIPAWVAQDEALVDSIAQVILDQSIKGRGYPVALAEAHEQAVVKGPDRDFFYHLLTKIGIEQKQHINISRKALRKRSIGV
jgi:hypothetical protein